ncbi:hypothetical protein [Caulobacter mirabilis]|uniref:Glycerophosphoryl diester phosphodiesterase membrane domain-containing protein n=1 Tax=Caulobacter mirabilis TaxID=69666 RepID=A0A2D2AWT6_9CAUL|nr:hypothetical protein [Caulobacter mirabilis]ATQ42480.1 hypothetical protein CSW64_08660 [Caulobacter mirabilis]
MANLDVVRSATAGFGVIARNPLAVVVWGLVLLLVSIAPAILIMGGFLSSMIGIAAQQDAGVEPDPEAVMAMMVPMMAGYPLLFVTSILARVMMTGAIFRSVLEPEARRWFYLRLGAQELWMGLVMVVLAIMAGMLFSVLWLFGAILVGGVAVASGALSSSEPPVWLALAVLLIALAGLGGLIWLALRFSMALPMSFAERQFRLFESWSFTRGKVGGLFLIGLLVAVIVFVLEMVLVAVGFLVFGLALVEVIGVTGGDEKAVEALFQQPPQVWMAAVAPWLVIGGVVLAVVGAALTTLVTAPWAEAYRQIKGPTPDPEPQPSAA